MSSSADDFSVEYGSKVTGACVACKRAHHACDQERPQCARCIRLGCSCEYVLHRKPGRKRLQAIPPPEIEDVSAKKRRLLSDVARDGSHSSSSSSSSSSSAPLMSAASSATSAAHRAPRPPSTAPRPPQEQRHNPSILPFPKKISSATSHAPYGSFPQSDGGGDRFPMESAKVSPKFSNFESSSSSTETFLENLQSIRRPGQKSTESGGNRGVGDSNDMKRFPPHTHFPSPHHSGVSKNISEFHNLVLEGERELMSFNRMQKDEGPSTTPRFSSVRSEQKPALSRSSPADSQLSSSEWRGSWDDNSRRPSWEDKSIHLKGPLKYGDRNFEGGIPRHELVMKYLAEKDIRGRASEQAHPIGNTHGTNYIPKFNPFASGGGGCDAKKSPPAPQSSRSQLSSPLLPFPPSHSQMSDVGRVVLPKLMFDPPCDHGSSRSETLPSINYLLNSLPHGPE